MSLINSKRALREAKGITVEQTLVNILTPRQIEVLDYTCQGFRVNEIAKLMTITNNTVKQHLYGMYKVTCMTKTELVAIRAVEKYKQENNIS